MYLVISELKLVPVNVISSPPYTLPYLGWIDVKNGVKADVYVIVPVNLTGVASLIVS